ncbi:MAG: hypothetical protein Q8Q23_04225 [bacterium]|nr:hypothetical protein [bacterium]
MNKPQSKLKVIEATLSVVFCSYFLYIVIFHSDGVKMDNFIIKAESYGNTAMFSYSHSFLFFLEVFLAYKIYSFIKVKTINFKAVMQMISFFLVLIIWSKAIENFLLFYASTNEFGQTWTINYNYLIMLGIFLVVTSLKKALS